MKFQKPMQVLALALSLLSAIPSGTLENIQWILQSAKADTQATDLDLSGLESNGRTTDGREPKGDEFGNPDLKILLDEKELYVKYNDYFETELSLEGSADGEVEWKILQDETPMGVQLESAKKSKVLLFGTPQFTDLWCFVVSATAKEGQSFREICLFSADNDQIQYPKFKSERFL